MKLGYTVKRDGVLYPAGTDVPVGVPKKVELTNHVPEGALDENPDGSVNAYDEAGNKVGTVSAEELERLDAEAGEVVEAPKQANRGRKTKEA